MSDNTARSLYPNAGYALRPENAMDMRVVKVSQNPGAAASARASRKAREAERTAQGLCAKCGLSPVHGKKTCYTCVKRQELMTARSILRKFGYNPDFIPELRLP